MVGRRSFSTRDRWASRRELVRERNSARQARARLERELAAYTSPSDLAELYAMASRSSAEDSKTFLEVLDALPVR